MTDLFSSQTEHNAPLPGRMRPVSWEDFVGQEALRKNLQDRPVHSMILYGPPGTGKTTIARILARESGLQYYELSAVASGVKEVREVIAKGKSSALAGNPVLLFIDEIHRFSKSQQDALLQAVESGWVVLIGATTENPSFEVIGPLLSRAQVYRLQLLTDEQLRVLLERAHGRDPLLLDLEIQEDAKSTLIEAAGGDGRKLLRWLEIAAQTTKQSGQNRVIDRDRILEVLQNSVRNYDKAGENHYDFISAFIKSMRGSDPDGALLYLACMIDGGEDPLFIARRMVIFASEDVGNAYPQALQVTLSAFQALERIGMPEGRIILAQAATYLCGVPKSNASYTAIDEALRLVRAKRVTVPNHLRNAPTKTHRAEGAGQGYQYPHDSPGAFAGQDCRPPEFASLQLYFPSDRGQEERIRERLSRLWTDRNYGE